MGNSLKVKVLVEELLSRKLSPFGIINSGNVGVGPETPDENIRAMFRAVWKYGKLE